MIVKYSSNNSGGDWWLTDEDWKKLENAGWKVNWIKDQKDSFLTNKNKDRWLGALATSATLETDSVDAAIESFQNATGQDPDAAGCSCCGQPHYFYEE